MNTKHTPGNWRFAWHNNHDAQITFACVVLDDEMVVIGHGAEKVAKAHLIAAAPELLEALQAVVAVSDRATDEFDRARAAIAKATGASHVQDA